VRGIGKASSLEVRSRTRSQSRPCNISQGHAGSRRCDSPSPSDHWPGGRPSGRPAGLHRVTGRYRPLPALECHDRKEARHTGDRSKLKHNPQAGFASEVAMSQSRSASPQNFEQKIAKETKRFGFSEHPFCSSLSLFPSVNNEPLAERRIWPAPRQFSPSAGRQRSCKSRQFLR
jgi:hypothetical protein